ncbi:MAG TPA: hypothetical protein VFP40_00620 [Terriglobales bacterium]|nr:hypothetical protein [Terriglobales bacterium]
MQKVVSSFLLTLALAASSFAATLTGTVTNATSGKPSVGDEVALINLAQGMSVISQTKSDGKGAFSFTIDDANVPHLVRVTHDGVNYFPQGGPVRPGTTTADIAVYDAAKKVEGVSTNVTVMRVQADGGQLQILELVAVKNDSKPPRTLAGDHTYEVYLPEGAEINQVIAQGPGGMPINTSATPEGKTGKYSFNYAIKPGETRFEIAFHMPYSGEASFAPKITDKIQHFVVMLPKSMTFEAKDASKFSPMSDDPSSTVQVATNVTPGADLAFRVSGTGMLQDEQQQQGQQAQQPQSGGAMGSGAVADNRPGGGMAPPSDAPDPLHNYRWPILGGFAIVLVAGAVFVVSRSNQQNGQQATPVVKEPPPAPVWKTTPPAKAVAAPAQVQAPANADRSSMLLEGLKEELFQLEVEKQQGRISAEEYETAKAALDQTLRRALSRAKASS